MSGKHPHFTPQEFEARLARLRKRLDEIGVDAALFDEIEAMTWISGYGNSENRWRCVVIPTSAGTQPCFVIRALDAGPCRRQNWIEDVPTFCDWEEPFAVLASSLASRGLDRGRIGLDYNSYCMPLARFEKLRSALPHATFVDTGPLISELRLIKSPTEIALLEQASAIADAAIVRVAQACKRGGTQREAAQVAVATFVELGADPGKPGPISAGRGWDFLHAAIEERPLADGDVVHLELVPSVGGYSARLMRCVPIGKPSEALLAAARSLADLQDSQIAAMVPGARACDVDAILRQGLLLGGLRESFDNISGYTLGLYAQAGPRTSDFTRVFDPTQQWCIEPGMVFHMYASAAGVSFSETVLIEAKGPRRLTRLERKPTPSG